MEQSDYQHANDLIGELRQHSSAYGNAQQRMAHYFTEALVSFCKPYFTFPVTDGDVIVRSYQLEMTEEVDFLTEAMMGIFEAGNIVTIHKWQMFCGYVIICL